MKVSVIGMGNMGAPIAERFIKAGHQVTVYNRTRVKAKALESKGAIVADTPAEAIDGSEIVLSMLADDSAVESVVYGEDGIMEALPEGGVHVSSSTISIDLSEKLQQEHHDKGQYFVAAPVMGRPDAVVSGDIRVIIAGQEEGRAKAWPLFEALSDELFVVGEESLMANVCKLGNNFLLVSMLESVSEAMTLVQEYGVDKQKYMDIVNAFFRSPIYKNYGEMMVEENFEPAGFKMTLGQKDTNLARSAAKRANRKMPVADLANEHFEYGNQNGFKDLDWSAMIKVVEDQTKL